MRVLSSFLFFTLAAGVASTPRLVVTEAMVVEATVDQLQSWMKSGQLTSRRLTEIYLAVRFGRRDFSIEDERDFDARVKTMRHFRLLPERAA